ncbi:MAG: site-specific integrase [Ruminococcus sp.]|nr:site-specific integrase [Ruminococcus sp.]
MSNRERGEGSISKRKDGTWTGRIYLGRNADGKQIIKAVYGKTEKEVKQRIKEIKEELIKYDNITLSKVTLEELLTDWLQGIKKYELKPSSYDRLEHSINHNIIPYIGYLQISNIKPNDIQRYINTLTDKGYSYSTIKKAYNAVNASLRLATERDYIRKNPCATVRLPKQIQRPKSDIEFFTDSELELITKSATFRYQTGNYKYKHGYAIIILMNTGMRVGELLALKWKNVDLDNRQIFVTETREQIIDRSDSKQKYIMVDQSTKTQSSCRYIPINDKTAEAIFYFKSLGYKNPYVMANSDNSVVSYRNLFRVLSNILEYNNINHGSLHTLRHTFATKLFKNGVDIKIISELLGHSDINITYDIYTHVIQEQKKKAVEVLDCL